MEYWNVGFRVSGVGCQCADRGLRPASVALISDLWQSVLSSPIIPILHWLLCNWLHPYGVKPVPSKKRDSQRVLWTRVSTLRGSRMHVKCNVSIVFLCVTWLVAASANPVSYACTGFMMTDGDLVLVGNNEDYKIPYTRVWFVPAEKEKYGRIYFGYERNLE